jgi:predicted alpha/beta-fold hydrolase
MHQYFDSGHKSQQVFVLHGLGGSGKSQIAFKFLEDSQANKWYDFTQNSQE